MKIKPEDYDNLRTAGRINGQVLAALRDALRPGMKTKELDVLARRLLKKNGAEPAFLGYPPNGEHPYPASINVSVNEELVHGIPGERRIKSGDIVTLDCGTAYNGVIADSAITVPVGKVPNRLLQLIQATEHALYAGIQLAQPGRKVGDISFAIQTVLRKYRVSIPPQFGGHGVGYSLHDAPHVANWGKPNKGDSLEVGMALAIEPMGMYGNPTTALLADHWTVVTKDKSWCAHTEHTVLLTENGAEIMTPVPPPSKKKTAPRRTIKKKLKRKS